MALTDARKTIGSALIRVLSEMYQNRQNTCREEDFRLQMVFVWLYTAGLEGKEAKEGERIDLKKYKHRSLSVSKSTISDNLNKSSPQSTAGFQIDFYIVVGNS